MGKRNVMKYSEYRIEDDRIVFDFYEFHFSSMRKNKVLTLDRIKSANFNTFPVSMKIDKGETIFFNHSDEETIRSFVEKHSIKESKSTDIWELICIDYLDTEFEPEIIKASEQKLKEKGFSEKEIQGIRKRIKWSMFGTLE